MFRSTNEVVQQQALKDFYKEIEASNRNKRKIETCKRFSRVYYPTFCILFVATFWVMGIQNSES